MKTTKYLFICVMVGLGSFFSNTALADGASCVYFQKDYTSPGYSIPKRQGLKIVGRFGCIYSCECRGIKETVTHTLTEKHVDLNVWSETETGGPSRAQWFICPRSINENSWVARKDLMGRILYYDVQMNETRFSPQDTHLLPELRVWEAKNCQ